MALLFEIQAGSPEPIYEQIKAQIRRAIAAGRLREGDQMPSVRVLAEQLTINPNTVARAYTDLSAAGLLETRQGRGVFVAPRRQIYSLEERKRRLDAAIRALLDEVAFLDLPLPQILKRIKELSDQSPPEKP